MGYLKLAILVLAYALISPAFAQTCCPAGCAQEGDRCVTTGPPWTRCIPIACAGGSGRPSAGTSDPTGEHRKNAVLARPLRTARTYVVPRQIPPQCPLMNPTKAQVDEATGQCVNALTGSAQLRGLFFRGRCRQGEDKRTGLSCPDRQAALAKQCLRRCTATHPIRPIGLRRQLSEHRLAYVLWRYLGRHRSFHACRPLRASAKSQHFESTAAASNAPRVLANRAPRLSSDGWKRLPQERAQALQDFSLQGLSWV